MRYFARQTFAISAAVLLFISGAGAQTTRPATQPENASKFLRYSADGKGGGKLETSVVTYKNTAGATVDLIAAVHVADPGYFHALDASFADYDALLFEMVKPKEAEVLTPQKRQAKADEEGAASLSWVSLIQRGLKTTLKLSFQLDEIDYTRKNFVHADLDAETFEKMQEERGESIFGLMLKQALREFAKGPTGNGAAQLGLPDILMALQDPEAARRLKLILARQFANMDDLIGGLDDPEKGSVLLTERNKAAIKTLDERLKKGDRAIGIFFGAAHLSGMEKMLLARGFKQAGEPVWHTAWDMTAPDDPAVNSSEFHARESSVKKIMLDLSEDKIYAAIGEEGFTRLIAAFYRRVVTDDILGPMYPKHDIAGAEERLRDFLVGRFGGTKLRC